MSFSYTHIDNPTGVQFNFTATYSDTSEIIVQGYNGKHWSSLDIQGVVSQSVILRELTNGLEAIRISNIKDKVDSPNANGSDGNMIRSGGAGNDDLEIRLSDPTDRTGSAPLTPEGITLGGLLGSVSETVQGYYGILSSFYFGGSATETEIGVDDINTWVDVELTADSAGVFDYRPSSMKAAQPLGHLGSGTAASPIIFSLEGLDIQAFANFRASLSFEPAEDEGQFESRLLFNRHSGTTPITDFSIEEVSLSMQNGADIDYVSEPMLSFFVGDTIDTNGVGDAGRCRFQIKSNVEGTLKLRALTWYINK